MSNGKIKIFLVDDDAVFLKSLEIDFLQSADFEIVSFATGELCIAELGQKPDLVILDYHLDGIDKTAINGLDTLDRIKAIDNEISVIILSSQDKIEVAVNCMHHRAFDYVVKSETAFMRLQKNIKDIFHVRKLEKQLHWYMDRI
jgi:two-component system, OmpR family, response regulator